MCLQNEKIKELLSLHYLCKYFCGATPLSVFNRGNFLNVETSKSSSQLARDTLFN